LKQTEVVNCNVNEFILFFAMAEDVLFEFLHMEIVNLMYDSSATNDEQVTTD